jgi:glycosyltransferase involved in cell wall biosynthesis
MSIGGICVVRNEQNFIYYALKSILPFVNGMVVIDNCSTDRTVAEIKRAGVDPLVMEGTVAELRNKAADIVDCDWVWWIDGDEVWPTEEAEKVVRYTDRYAEDESVSILQPRLLRFIGDRFHYDRCTVYSMPRIYKHKDVRMYGKSFPFCVDALARDASHLKIIDGLIKEARVDEDYIVPIDATFYHYAECGSLLHRKTKWFRYIQSSNANASTSDVMERLRGATWGVSSPSFPFNGPQPEVFQEY